MLVLPTVRGSLELRGLTGKRDDAAREDTRGVDPSMRIRIMLDSGIAIDG